jgi:3',5'-cyclic AMP phosphodiesterase CpdA
MSINILHLSDLHLANDLVLRSLGRLKPWWKRPATSLTEGLKNAVRELHPEYVVISGDFVNKPTPGCFSAAAEYVRNVLLDAGVDIKTRLLVVPGNHDASFIPRAQPDDAARLGRYRNFLQQLFGEKDVETRKLRYIHADEQEPVIFACLDSTLKDHFPLAEGQVGMGQIEWLERKMRKVERRSETNGRQIKIAVLHHHCNPHPRIWSGRRTLYDPARCGRSFAGIRLNRVQSGPAWTQTPSPCDSQAQVRWDAHGYRRRRNRHLPIP